MPKSRKRPAAVAKSKAAAQRTSVADDGLGFVESPWSTWQRVAQDARPDQAMLTVLEHSPFRVGDGAWTSLAEMASDARQTVAETVGAYNLLESWGSLVWDRASQSARPVVPVDS